MAVPTWQKQGFSSQQAYRDNLAQAHGFPTYTAMRNAHAQAQGFASYGKMRAGLEKAQAILQQTPPVVEPHQHTTNSIVNEPGDMSAQNMFLLRPRAAGFEGVFIRLTFEDGRVYGTHMVSVLDPAGREMAIDEARTVMAAYILVHGPVVQIDYVYSKPNRKAGP